MENQHQNSLKLQKIKKENLNIFLSVTTIGVLVGGLVIYHDTYDLGTNNPTDKMCPISKILYACDMTEEAYKHQIKHLEKFSNVSGNNIEYKYMPESYSAPIGYTMNEDGKSCFTESFPNPVEVNNQYFQLPAEGDRYKNNKYINTIDANYSCECIMAINHSSNQESMFYYDEEQKKLVKM